MDLISTLGTLFAAILGVGFIIGFHELGHFLFGKLFDVKTPSFSIGFGPRIFSRKIGETNFSISAIPLGGYVEVALASPDDPKSALDKRLFTNKPYYQKFLIVIAGIGFNFIFAYAAMIGLMLSGIPKSPFLYPFNNSLSMRPTLEAIEKGSPAEKAGLQIGDQLISINDIEVHNNAQRAFDALRPLGGQKVSITFNRDNRTKTVTSTLDSREILGEKVGSLGARFEIIDIPPLPFSEAIAKGISFVNSYALTTIKALRASFTQGRSGLNNFAGPIMIISTTMQGAAEGAKAFVLLLVIISIGIALLNCIPLPILDGGRILLFTIESIIGRPLPARVQEAINVITLLIMLFLIVYLTIADTSRVGAPYFALMKAKLGF